MSEMSEQMAYQVFESVKEALDAREITYEAKDDKNGNHIVIFNYRGEDTSHRMVIRVIVDIGLVSFSELLNFTVEAASVDKIVHSCNRINNSLLFGTFYFDYEDRDIYFYNPLLFNNSIVSRDTIDEMILRTVSIVEDYDDRLSAVNKGYLDPEKILAK